MTTISQSMYAYGATHLAVVEMASFFECANCGADVDEPTDIQVAIEWSKNPKMVHCEHCDSWMDMEGYCEDAEETLVELDYLTPPWKDEFSDSDEDIFSVEM